MVDVEKGHADRVPESEEAPLLDSRSSLLGVTPTGVRLGFIRKVYGIVLAQILLTSVIASIMMFVEPVRVYVRQSPGMYFLSFATALLAVLILAFSYIQVCPCYGLYKVYPANYVLLTLFVRPRPAAFARSPLMQAPAGADAGRELRSRRDLLLPHAPGRCPRPCRHGRHCGRPDHVCDDRACGVKPNGAGNPPPPTLASRIASRPRPTSPLTRESCSASWWHSPSPLSSCSSCPTAGSWRWCVDPPHLRATVAANAPLLPRGPDAQIYASVGALIMSIYLVIDTQMLVGKFGSKFGEDDYILAALNIYLDVISTPRAPALPLHIAFLARHSCCDHPAALFIYILTIMEGR